MRPFAVGDPWTSGTSVWTFDLFIVINLGLLISLYLVGVTRVRGKSLTWPRLRTASFFIGIGLLAFAPFNISL